MAYDCNALKAIIIIPSPRLFIDQTFVNAMVVNYDSV